MKENKMRIYLIVFVIFIVFLWFSPKIFFPDPDPAWIPQCFVQQDGYFYNQSEVHYEKEIEKEYLKYGKITSFIEYKTIADLKDLSTNYNEYMNKDVYLNKADTTYIYLKYDEQQYLKLKKIGDSEVLIK